jgi:hypothetical protein
MAEGGADLATARPVMLQRHCHHKPVHPRHDETELSASIGWAVRAMLHSTSKELQVNAPGSARTGHGSRNASSDLQGFAGQQVVGRTLHHANHPAIVTGNPLPGHLSSSRAGRAAMETH